MPNIKISPKHGLNPCIPICMFCGKEKNEIALLGRLKGDKEAPMNAVVDYRPCEQCEKNWSMGVPLIRVQTDEVFEGMPPLTVQNGVKLYPTGDHMVMTTEAVHRIFGIEGKEGSPMLLDSEVFDKLMEDAKRAGAVEDTEDKKA